MLGLARHGLWALKPKSWLFLVQLYRCGQTQEVAIFYVRHHVKVLASIILENIIVRYIDKTLDFIEFGF